MLTVKDTLIFLERTHEKKTFEQVTTLRLFSDTAFTVRRPIRSPIKHRFLWHLKTRDAVCQRSKTEHCAYLIRNYTYTN